MNRLHFRELTRFCARTAGFLQVALAVAAAESTNNNQSLEDAQTRDQASQIVAKADANLQEGRRLMRSGETDAAIKVLNEALNQYNSIALLPERAYGMGRVYAAAAEVYAREDDYTKARDTWRRALGSFRIFIRSENDFWEQALKKGSGYEDAAEEITKVYLGLADAFEAVGDKERRPDAVEELRAFSARIRKASKPAAAGDAASSSTEEILAAARALNNQAGAFLDRDQLTEALAKSREAGNQLAQVPPSSDPEIDFESAKAAGIQGAALSRRGRYADAVPPFRRALSLFERLAGEDEFLFTITDELADALFRSQRPNEAIEVYKRAAELAKVRDKANREYHILCNLIVLYSQFDEFSEAEAIYARAEEVAARGPTDPDERARLTKNMACSYRDNDKDEKAVELFKKRISILESVNGTEGLRAESHLDVALGLQKLKEPAEARQWLERGLALARSVDDAKIAEAKLRRALAEDDVRLGHPDALFEENERLVQELANVPGSEQEIIKSLIEMGRYHHGKGQYDQAIAKFKRVHAIAQSAPPSGDLVEDWRAPALRVSLNNLGVSYLGAGRFGDAADAFSKAGEVGWPARVETMLHMSAVQRLRHINNLTSSRDYAIDAAFSSPLPDARSSYQATLKRKGLHTAIGRMQRRQAAQAARADPIAPSTYLELRKKVARRVIEWQSPGESFGNTGADSVEQLMRRIDAQERTTLRESSGLKSLLLTFSPEAVVRAVRTNEVLIEYVRFSPFRPSDIRPHGMTNQAPDEEEVANTSPKHLGAFVICGTSGKIPAIDLGPVAEIESMISDYLHALEAGVRPPYDASERQLAKLGEQLRKKLLDPMAPYLEKATRLYIAPEGGVTLLPFEALPQSGESDAVRYIVERYEIVYLQSGRDLLDQPGEEPGGSLGDAVIVADPAFDASPAARLAALGKSGVDADNGLGATASGEDGVPTNWPRLEQTHGLAQLVSDLSRRADVRARVLEQTNASEENLSVVRNPRFLLFATHGYFRDASPRLHFTLTGLRWGGGKPAEMKGLNIYKLLGADPLMNSMVILSGASRRNHRIPLYRSGDQWFTAREAEKRGNDVRKVESELSDGILTAYEASGLELAGTEVVVLAGCQTGLGVVQGSEGRGMHQAEGEVLSGFRQSAMVAGAQSIVMSLWSVPEVEATREVGSFFSHWITDKRPRYAAFRQAQLDALKHSRQNGRAGYPYWWAGFIYARQSRR